MSMSKVANRRKRSEEKAFFERVIGSVKLKSCLFDRSNEDFTDDDVVDKAWKDVAHSSIDNVTPESEEEMVKKVQVAWDACKKSFSRERSRREQQPSSNGGWSLYEQMSFMDPHIKRQKRPRSGNSAVNSSTKKTKVNDSQKENLPTPNLLNHSASGLAANQQESADQHDSDGADDEMQHAAELARREKQLQDMEARLAREKALELKKERLEAQQEEARILDEQRRQEREARKQEIAKQSKREASEIKLIKTTADYIVGVLDSTENEDDRMELAQKIMNILYTR